MPWHMHGHTVQRKKGTNARWDVCPWDLRPMGRAPVGLVPISIETGTCALGTCAHLYEKLHGVKLLPSSLAGQVMFIPRGVLQCACPIEGVLHCAERKPLIGCGGWSRRSERDGRRCSGEPPELNKGWQVHHVRCVWVVHPPAPLVPSVWVRKSSRAKCRAARLCMHDRLQGCKQHRFDTARASGF